jgi:probable HAF family extracellular repeat protein
MDKSMEELYTMNVKRILTVVCFSSYLLLSAGKADAQKMKLVDLGKFFVTGVSADGKAVGGLSDNKTALLTRSGVLTNAPQDAILYPYAISGDGTAVVGDGSGVGVRWQGGSTTLIGAPPTVYTSTSARSISYDGSVVVGNMEDTTNASGPGVVSQAYRWTAEGGAVGLGALGQKEFTYRQFGSKASDVSPDGKTVVGGSGYTYSSTFNGVTTEKTNSQAYKWTAETGMRALGDIAGGIPSDPSVAGSSGSYAYATSADGNVIVGSAVSNKGTEAFVWTPTTGMVGLGDLPRGGYFSLAEDVSGDGSVVVGTGSYERYNAQYGILESPDIEAFIWTSGGGMLSIKDILMQSGMDMSDWKLRRAISISTDGSTIVGYGTYKGVSNNFMLYNEEGTMMQFLQGMGLGGNASIPEPSTLAFLALAPIAMALRKKK